MTICISAICEDKCAVVVASDRLITSYYPPTEFEHDAPKLTKITKSFVALTAGVATERTELFQTAKKSLLKQASPQIGDVVRAIKDSFVAIRTKKTEDKYFKPRGMTIDDYYKRIGFLPEAIVYRLDRYLAGEELNVEILVAGADSTGGHVYEIKDPGVSTCLDSIGYGAVGSGYLHAVQNFISNRYLPIHSLEKCLYVVYESKRVSEKSPGVGTSTDMTIVTNDSIVEVDENTLKLLADHYEEKMNKRKPILEEAEKLLKNQVKEYKNQAKKEGEQND